MYCRPDPWLEAQLGCPAFRVDLGTEPSPDVADRLSEEMRDRPGFYYSKVPTSDVAACHLLESLGFRLIDTNLVFEKPRSDRPAEGSGYAVRAAEPADAPAVVEIARRSFEFSRFHLDPSIPAETADRLKAEWAGNYFRGERGDAMVVATVGDRLVGFNQLIRDEARNALVIDLIAVDSGYRGRGIAGAMIAEGERSYGQQVDRSLVGTQAANVASVRFYEKLGFRLLEAHYVFHCHAAHGAA